jgi:hypothetical protein
VFGKERGGCFLLFFVFFYDFKVLLLRAKQKKIEKRLFVVLFTIVHVLFGSDCNGNVVPSLGNNQKCTFFIACLWCGWNPNVGVEGTSVASSRCDAMEIVE